MLKIVKSTNGHENSIIMWEAEAHLEADVEICVLEAERDQYAAILLTNEEVIELRDLLNEYLQSKGYWVA